MILQNIWGLLLLLSVPALIIIYILKREHKEKAVGSAYLWKLSDRFLKKRRPLKLLSVLLAFLLQLSILVLTSVGAATPMVWLGNTSSHIVIIDASASMQTELDGVTRFDRAVEQAIKTANSGLCTSMTVIVASDTPSCPVLGGTPVAAVDVLEKAECTWGGCDVYAAMKLAREAYGAHGSAKVTFYTDTDYAYVENVDIVDMRADEVNVAITDLSCVAGRFTGTVTCYGEDREVSVALYVDDVPVDVKTVFCTDAKGVEVTFDSGPSNFRQAKLVTEVQDSLPADNESILIGKMASTATVLLVGNDTTFLEAGLAALGRCDVTVKSTFQHSDDGKYDLYLLHACIPEDADRLPRKGTVVGFIQKIDRQGRIADIWGYQRNNGGYMMPLTSQYEGEADPLLKGTDGCLEKVYVANSFSSSTGATAKWTSISTFQSYLSTSCLRRVLDNGYYQYLFPFELSETNMPLTPAFMLILQNAVELASPPITPETRYAVGETVPFTLKAGASELSLLAPDGTTTSLATQSPTCVPREVGIYTLRYEQNGNAREASFSTCLPESEYLTQSEDSVYLLHNSNWEEQNVAQYKTVVPYVAVALLIILMIEWGYYCHARY